MTIEDVEFLQDRIALARHREHAQHLGRRWCRAAHFPVVHERVVAALQVVDVELAVRAVNLGVPAADRNVAGLRMREAMKAR